MTKLSALALAAAILSIPAIALAQNSASGSFTFTLNPTAAPGGSEYVQILGLDNERIDLGTIQSSQNASTPWVIPDLFFCIKRSAPGIVRVTVSQAQTNQYEGFRLQNPTNMGSFSNPAGYNDALGLSLYLYSADDSDADYLANGVATDQIASAAGCDANSGLGVAHRLRFQPGDIPAFASFPRQGLYSGLFTVTVSLP